MTGFLQRYLTTEAIFSVTGGVWFVVSALFPVIPGVMLIPAMPPLVPFDVPISPGLLVGVSLVPVLLKAFMPGKTPFVGTGASVTAANVPVDVTEQKDA